MLRETIPGFELIFTYPWQDKHINWECLKSSTAIWQRIFYFKKSELIFAFFHFAFLVFQFYYILQKYPQILKPINTQSSETLP